MEHCLKTSSFILQIAELIHLKYSVLKHLAVMFSHSLQIPRLLHSQIAVVFNPPSAMRMGKAVGSVHRRRMRRSERLFESSSEKRPDLGILRGRSRSEGRRRILLLVLVSVRGPCDAGRNDSCLHLPDVRQLRYWRTSLLESSL